MERHSEASSIVLGRRYRDRIHGIEGVAVARAEFLTGCDRVTLEFRDSDNKNKLDRESFDVSQLEEIPSQEPVATSAREKSPGGPADIPAKPELG